MGNYQLQRGGPNDEHTDRQTTATTIHKPHRDGNPATSRPNTNYLPTSKTDQKKRANACGSTTGQTASEPTIRRLAPRGIN